MPEPNAESSVAAAQAAKPKPPVKDSSGHVERGGRDFWLERVRRFKGRHRRHALAGALSNLGPEETLTQSEVQKRLDEFLSPDRGGRRS